MSENQAPQTPLKKKKSKKIVIIICIATILAVAAGAFFFISSGNKQEALSEYETYVGHCKSLVDNAAGDTEKLIQVKSLIQDSLVAMEESLALKAEKRKSTALMQTLEPMLKRAATLMIEDGLYQEDENAYGLALRSYDIAYTLWPDEGTKEKMSAIAGTCSYLCVSDILFTEPGNRSAEPKCEFDANESMRALMPIVYFSLKSDEMIHVKLFYKLYTSSGQLVELNCSEEGYTSAGNDIFSSVGKDTESLELSPWGVNDGFVFSPDTYQFDLWNENTLLFRKYIKIK